MRCIWDKFENFFGGEIIGPPIREKIRCVLAKTRLK